MKGKKTSFEEKNRCILLLNACMCTGNDLVVIYTSQKILKRLLIFAKKKPPPDGDEYFKNLLLGIQDWAKRFPTFDKHPSPFAKGYNDLLSKKVLFPRESSRDMVGERKQRSKSANPRAKQAKIDRDVEDIRQGVETCKLVIEILNSGQAKESGELFIDLV